MKPISQKGQSRNQTLQPRAGQERALYSYVAAVDLVARVLHGCPGPGHKNGEQVRERLSPNQPHDQTQHREENGEQRSRRAPKGGWTVTERCGREGKGETRPNTTRENEGRKWTESYTQRESPWSMPCTHPSMPEGKVRERWCQFLDGPTGGDGTRSTSWATRRESKSQRR